MASSHSKVLGVTLSSEQKEMAAITAHSVHFKTEPKNHTENKPNRTDFFVFMVSGFGMVWTFHTDLNFGFYGIYQKTEWLTE